MPIAKEKRQAFLQDFLKKQGMSYEHGGFLEGGDTVYGVMTTKRGAKFHVRAFGQRDWSNSTVVVRSSQTINRNPNPNSIKTLINNQVLKGKILGKYSIPRE